jgi:hypothetical protein
MSKSAAAGLLAGSPPFEVGKCSHFAVVEESFETLRTQLPSPHTGVGNE